MNVLITGASSDIGIEVCKIFLDEGWNVFGQYNKNIYPLEELKKRFPKNMNLIKLDFLEDKNALESHLIEYSEIYGQIDSFVSCAALLRPKRYDEIKVSDLIEHLSVNLIPGVMLLKMVVPGQVKRCWGRNLIVSSIGVKFGGGLNTYPYSLAKYASEFLPSCARDWTSSNILTNVLRVGVTDTKIHSQTPDKDINKRVSLIPIKRMATPDEIARYIFFLTSGGNSYISGQVLSISGGE